MVTVSCMFGSHSGFYNGQQRNLLAPYIYYSWNSKCCCCRCITSTEERAIQNDLNCSERTTSRFQMFHRVTKMHTVSIPFCRSGTKGNLRVWKMTSLTRARTAAAPRMHPCSPLQLLRTGIFSRFSWFHSAASPSTSALQAQFNSASCST